MKHNILVAFLFVCLCVGSLSVSCTSAAPAKSGPETEIVVMDKPQNAEAMTALLAALKAHFFDATRFSDEDIRLVYDKDIFFLSPKVGKNELDRIVVTKFYSISPKYHGQRDVISWVLKLNNKINSATFSTDEEIKVLSIQCNLTFVDRIEWQEIKLCLDYLNKTMAAVLITFPEGVDYLSGK